MKTKVLTLNNRKFTIYEDGRILRNARINQLGRSYPAQWINGGNGPYLGFGFTEAGKTCNYSIHRLVAMAFLPDYSSDLQVDHKNGNKKDNRPQNLRMVTPQQNNFAYKPNRVNSSSQYRCVSYCKKAKKRKWMVKVQSNGKTKFIGSFETERLAGIAANITMLTNGYLLEALNNIE